MKKVTILMTAVLLSSCSITQYYVDNEYTLSTVENNVKNVEVKTFNYTYSDDLIDVTMKFGEKSIDFSMINMSNSSIKILWDDAAYMDQYGGAHRVIHTGVKLIDKDKAQIATILPKGANVSDGVVPEDLVSWNGGAWVYEPLSNLRMFNTRGDADKAVANLNPTRLLLPVECNGVRYEYTYTFVNQDPKVVEVKQRNNRAVVGYTLGALLLTGLISYMLD